MKNYIQPGDTLPVAAPAAVLSGAGVLVGSLFGVAATNAESGATVQIKTMGVFDLTSATGTAWAVGDKIYWDDTNKRTTKTATNNTLIGVAVAAKASGDAVGRVRLGVVA